MSNTTANDGQLTFHLAGDAYDCGADLYRQLVFGTVRQAMAAIDAQAPAGRAAEARGQFVTGFAAGAFSQTVQELGPTAAAELFKTLSDLAAHTDEAMRGASLSTH